MLSKSKILTVAIVFAFSMILTAGQSAQADWSVSFRGGGGGHSPYGYSSDRLTSEYRRGYQVDDWIERGTSSVTESPIFSDGIKLAAWATRHDDDYDFGLASGIYFFEVPNNARSVRVKIYYEGEADRADINGDVAGRVWVRRTRIGDDYEEYYPRDGRYEDADEPLYGDTFTLRARKNLEIIRLSADDYVDDGVMELHVVAEGGQSIDVKYVEVETYSYLPRVRVVNRYYKDYTWQPWYNYTYWYFYTGPMYHFSDYYYVRYTYPRYHSQYVHIRKRYNNYLTGYHKRHPNRHVRWKHVARVPKGTRRAWDRARLSKWTRDHNEARKSYRVVSAKTRRGTDVRKSRTRITNVVERRRPSPSALRARSGEKVRVTTRRTTTTSGSRVPEMKRKSRSTDVRRAEQRDRISVQRRQTETRTEVRTRTNKATPSSKKRSNSSVRSSRNEDAKKSPSRSVSDSAKKRTKRESVRSQTSVKKESSTPKKSPPKQAEKDDDDDDDDEENKKKKRRRTR